MLRTGLCVVALLFLSLGTRIAFAQAGSADLTGQVLDSSGRLLVGAEVTVTKVETDVSTKTTSGSGGVYVFTSLPAGAYTVSAEATGFQKLVRTGVTLLTGERTRLDLKMTVGDVKESVTVSGDTPLLQTETGSITQSIDHEKVVELPLNGRTFVQLATLSPGVMLPPGTLLPRINGGRPRTNEYLFDGISALQPEPGQVVFFPIIDSIQEFNIQTNAVPAEFGRFNGGVVNLSTRTGSNRFHGSVWEFFRNEALNARNYFAPFSQRKPEFRRNQYGAALGGPIVKNHTFFFIDYQGVKQAIGTVRTSTVPTVLERQGNFTQLYGTTNPILYDPATTVGSTRAAFSPVNIIPKDRIDPAALAVLNRYPLPTKSGTANNFTLIGNDQDHQNQFDTRIDHRFSEKDQAFGRYSYFHDVDQPVPFLPDGSGNITTGVIGLTDTLGQQIAGSYIHTFSAHALNDFRFGYTRRSFQRRGVQLDSSPSQSFDIPGIPSNGAFNNALPIFNIAGYQQIGSPSNTNSNFRTDVTELVDTVSRLMGRHALKFGLDFRWERLDVIQPPNPTGVFQFTQLFTNQPGANAATTGDPLASFLLGQVQQFSIDLQGKVIRPRAHIQEYFVQDDWKATSRLTINGGVRWTLNFPSTDADNQGAVFDVQTQQLNYLGKNGYPNTARELHWHDFGPRLGLAYRLSDKTVLRSGYGLVWIEQTGITTPFTVPQFPFLQTTSQRTLDNINPAFVLSGGPSVAPIPLTPDAGLGQGVFTVNRNLGSGYAQQWNLAVQRDLTQNISFEVAYAGSHITHVGIPDVNINQLTVDQLATGAALTQKVPNPFFGQIPRSSSLGDPTIATGQLLKPFPRFLTVAPYRNNIGSTVYHAFEAKLEQRFTRGLSYLVSYTHSKLIDTASSVFDASILTGPIANFPVADSFNLRRERDSSTGDIPNVFVASYTWEIPVGRGHGFNPTGMLGAFTNGWQLTGIVTLQSGMPFAITQTTNFNSFAGFGVQRPNVVASPNLRSDQRTPKKWFNTSAFEVAPQFTLGSASRNPVRGPNYHDADIALIKHTPVREQLDVEFRAEFFNLTNTPAFGQPNGVLGSSAFGTITSTASDPRVIQFGLKLNY
jgi:Carboxypeptidase regulatory-like domain